jgi:hypothetical protein
MLYTEYCTACTVITSCSITISPAEGDQQPNIIAALPHAQQARILPCMSQRSALHYRLVSRVVCGGCAVHAKVPPVASKTRGAKVFDGRGEWKRLGADQLPTMRKRQLVNDSDSDSIACCQAHWSHQWYLVVMISNY